MRTSGAPTGADPDVPDLAWYDIILFSSSGGKDSQAALDVLAQHARAAGVMHRIVVVHADLGEMEWEGAKELAQEHARDYGLRFETVSRYTKFGNPQTLLEQIEARRRFPDSKRRYCSSDHKRGPIRTVMTYLTSETRGEGIVDRPVRILNVMGMRAEESADRALKVSFRHDGGKTCTCPSCQGKERSERGNGASNSRRYVDEWLPVHSWTVGQIWERIHQAGTRYHWAYDTGLARLSCCFCVLAPKNALVLAAQLNPQLAAEYAAVEERIGHSFKVDLSMAEVIEIAQSTARARSVLDWKD
ncbi:phosphoadenosine phosphosulfate reductase family protein [Actinomadura rayongensis]|uniref:Phosphoadenosine phosphosulfate reductase family protein n=1 Tax=Actinomadura rayongensis TaxID=1429076 RepID=A0A6I4W8U6_9ACTN|nr:phosphoadenosine phosphosulfate reductase family protein [Actinomadura rayongensis]MXQ65603.1 phosphoadenosine phosphosulfate reductase family protein [Actinomadura rayongensis]